MVADIVNSKPFMVLPIYMNFEQWAATLFIDFSSEDMLFPPPESDWKRWADAVKARNVFQNADVPSPHGFSDWRDWAYRLKQAVNG